MANNSHSKDAKRLALILLFMPFTLWISMLVLSLKEKVAPRVYEYGFDNYINFAQEPIYWNTLLRTGTVSLLVTALALLIGFPVAYYIAKIASHRTKGALFYCYCEKPASSRAFCKPAV